MSTRQKTLPISVTTHCPTTGQSFFLTPPAMCSATNSRLPWNVTSRRVAVLSASIQRRIPSGRTRRSSRRPPSKTNRSRHSQRTCRCHKRCKRCSPGPLTSHRHWLSSTAYRTVACCSATSSQRQTRPQSATTRPWRRQRPPRTPLSKT